MPWATWVLSILQHTNQSLKQYLLYAGGHTAARCMRDVAGMTFSILGVESIW